jgi:nitrogen fixation negative regulator NifL
VQNSSQTDLLDEACIAGIIESAMDGIISVDERQRIVLFNPAAEKMFGYRTDDLLGEPLDRLIPQRFQSAHREHVLDFCETNITQRTKGRLVPIYGLRANGDEFPIDASISQTPTPAGKLFTVILRDVTDRNRTDLALRESEQRYHSLFEHMISGYAYCRILFADGTPNDFVYLEVNRKFESLTGLKDVIGKKASEIIPGIREADPELIQTYGRVAATGKPERFETFVDSMGIWFDVEVYSPAKDHFVAVFDNITERKQAVEQMRLHYATLESAANAVVITDKNGEIIWVNSAFTQTTGYSREEVMGRNPRLLKSGKQDHAFYQEMWETILAGRVWRGTVVNRRKDGTLNHDDLTITPIRNGAGNITNFVGIKQDITEKTRAQEALQASELRYRRLFESAKDGILILDAVSGEIVDVNPFLIEMLGYSKEDLMGKELWEIGTFKDIVASREAFEELQRHGYIRYEDLPLKTRDGVTKQVEFVSSSYVAGNSSVIQCNVRDNTEHHLAEGVLRRTNERLEGALAELRTRTQELAAMTQQLWQASKLATMGELAASIAHELNNPLATVALRTESLLMEVSEDPVKRRPLEIIAQEVDRMATLVENLLQFSRRGHRQVSTLDPNEELATAAEFVQYHLQSHNIEVVREFADGLPSIQADRQQLRQVFLNLLTNASDAMPQGGKLILRTVSSNLGETKAVAIEFEDTGDGITPANLAKIWEPFFTTKPAGKGTGLGLAICRRIVEEHGGTIDIKTQAGHGTTIRIVLPATPSGASS